jgi:broad specificity phosphatase PhoE
MIMASTDACERFPAAGPTGTWRDPPLTALGQEQARELAAHFVDQEIEIDSECGPLSKRSRPRWLQDAES